MTFSRLNSTLPSEVVGFLFIVLLAAMLPLPSEALADDLDFTAEEQAWLDGHPVVRVGPAPDFPPVEFFDESGTFLGMAFVQVRWKKRYLVASGWN